jgi:ubiquinone/menaquinone biosynthesis C-methylase UbiE
VITRCDPDYLRRAAQSPVIQAMKLRAYDHLRVTTGSRVLDVGCGPGVDTIPLAKRVGPSGFVIGVDPDHSMVSAAASFALAEGVAANTRHQVGVGMALPLPDGEVDGCLCDRVLQHVSWPACRSVVAEAVRVLRRGGRLVLIDTDWGSLSIATERPELERIVAREHQLSFANPFSGRYLPALLRSSTAREVAMETTAQPLTYESVTFLLMPTLQRSVQAGRLSPAAGHEFLSSLWLAHAYGIWCAHVMMTLVAGER